MNDASWINKPHHLSSLDDFAETLDEHIKAFNSFEDWVSMHGRTPDIGKAKIKEILEKWPSVRSFEIILDEDLLAEQEACSYFGGTPTLPTCISWPEFVFRGKERRSMNFLAQIDCVELTQLYADHPLPKAGFLYFFDTWSDEDGLSDPSCQAIHSCETPDPIRRAVPRNIIAPRAWRLKFRNRTHTPQPGDDTSLAYPRRRIKLAKSKVCLPSADHLRRVPELTSSFSEREVENLIELFDEAYGDLRIAGRKEAFGFSDCNWKSYNSYLGGLKFKKAKDRGRFGLGIEHRLLGCPRVNSVGMRFLVEGLVMLAQFDSDDAMDFDWHDILELWIKPEDLANGDFSNVFALQS